MCVRFNNITQIAFKGPRIMKQINKIAVPISTRGSKVCSSVTQRSATESNQPRTSTTDFNQERGRETDSRSVVLLHQLSMYVWGHKVEKQSAVVCLEYITILILITTVKDTGRQYSVCAVTVTTLDCRHVSRWLTHHCIIVPDDATGRRCDCVGWC